MGNTRVAMMVIGLLGSLSLSANVAQASFWQAENLAERSVVDATGTQYFSSDESGLRRFLDQVPPEQSGQSLDIELPMPDGSMARYQIFESSIMEAGLAAKFPNIKSYEVRGIDFPGSYGRVDISPKGFRGMIDTPYGRLFIDPEQSRSGSYMARTNRSQTRTGDFQCDTQELPANQSPISNFSKAAMTANRVSGSLLGYRIAVSATQLYVSKFGGTVSGAMAEINTTINRVNQIYQRDLGIKLFLVADNDKLIDLFDTAGFVDTDVTGLLTKNQVWIDNRIGNNNYDIGHIFGGGNTGGLAALGSVCGSSKAQGATGTTNPTGDPFYIDYVAHEIGHQFGANHTFNGTTGSCGGGNRNGSTAFEPGGGSTIMAYAGICGGENLQDNSEATFHAGSISEINAFVSTTGASCATLLSISPTNADPVADAGSNMTIPARTAFSLTGSATDTDGDTLSYQWDQMNADNVETEDGGGTTGATFNTDLGNNPLFRSYVPQPAGARHLPLVENQIGTADIGETLPTTTRTLNFRLTARDCKGGQSTDDVSIKVVNTGSAFAVNTVVGATVNATPNITWNVSGTGAGSSVNCANVDIDLLSFATGGSTYGATSLLKNTDNDGDQVVTIPNLNNDNARIRVSCSDSIFYAISPNSFSLIGGSSSLPTDTFKSGVSTATDCSAIDTGTAVATGEGVTGSGGGSGGGTSASGSGGGGGAAHLTWLVVLAMLGVARGRRRQKLA